MLLRCLRAELIKFRRSPVWLAFVVLPIFPAILGTMNYLGNLGLLQSEWYSLWSQHTLFSSMFFLPALLGVFCAWQWRLEHTDHNWNSFLTAPVPVGDPVPGQADLGGGDVPALPGLDRGAVYHQREAGGPRRPHPAGAARVAGCAGPWAACRCARCSSISACVIRAFAPPVAFGLVGGIAGLMVTAQGFGYAFPYSLLCIGMRANNPEMELDFVPFLLSALRLHGGVHPPGRPISPAARCGGGVKQVEQRSAPGRPVHTEMGTA